MAAVQGIGAALLSPRLFADLCECGELIVPFRWQVRGPNSYWLLWKSDNPEPHLVSCIRVQFSAEGAEPHLRCPQAQR